jgi:hypothetical protein
MILPLAHGHRARGALILGRLTDTTRFDEMDLKMAAAFASQAAIAETSAAASLMVHGPSSRGQASLSLPLAYAPREVWRGQTALPATISVPTGSIVVWASAAHVKVGQYDTAPVSGGSLSPVFVSNGKVRLTGDGGVTVRVYAARKFPAGRED